MPTLLFADDGSLEADRAWLWVTQQVWVGWSLETVTCQPPFLGTPVGRERGRPRPWTPTDERDAPDALGFASAQHRLVEADPRVAVTNRDDVGLVVLGQKGRGALKSLHLGSTAEYAVQHLAAPTVIAKKPSAVRSVLVCTDGSVHADRAVDALLAMPWLDHIDLVQVIGVFQDGQYDNEVEIGIAVDVTIRKLTDTSALACRPRPVIRQDKPAPAILGEAAAMSADLIVLGTRGLNARRLGLLWGSTARAVIKLTESSVLVAHDLGLAT